MGFRFSPTSTLRPSRTTTNTIQWYECAQKRWNSVPNINSNHQRNGYPICRHLASLGPHASVRIFCANLAVVLSAGASSNAPQWTLAAAHAHDRRKRKKEMRAFMYVHMLNAYRKRMLLCRRYSHARKSAYANIYVYVSSCVRRKCVQSKLLSVVLSLHHPFFGRLIRCTAAATYSAIARDTNNVHNDNDNIDR